MSMEFATAWIALGSNLGDRLAHLRAGAAAIVERIHEPCAERPVASRIYETSPVGGPPKQTDFLNAVVRVRTARPPMEVLAILLDIEGKRGRVRGQPDGPRVLDLDILFFNDQVIRADGLHIPHPRLHLRRFVLEPLCDIDPGLIHPRLGRTMQSLLQQQVQQKNEERVTPLSVGQVLTSMGACPSES